MTEPNTGNITKVFVWDLPTRLFHWSLLSLVVTSVLTGLGWSELEDESDIHTWSGIGVITLVIFRLGWGIFGGRHARFTDFIKGPLSVLRYLKGLVTGKHEQWLGHNPMGGVSVIAMIVLLGLQASLGLFANDDSSVEGPLFELISKDTSDFITWLHYLNSIALYVVIGTHVLAIISYRLMGEHLVAAMVHGYKKVIKGSVVATSDAKGNIIIAIVILAMSAGLVIWILNLFGNLDF